MVHKFHIIRVPLIELIALAVYVRTQGLKERRASVSCWAMGVFAVFFSAYDAATGIATGFVRRNAQGLSAVGQAAVCEVVKDLRPYVALISTEGEDLRWLVLGIIASLFLGVYAGIRDGRLFAFARF
jgi:hypothetical protein